jgi:hypothetical protein
MRRNFLLPIALVLGALSFANARAQTYSTTEALIHSTIFPSTLNSFVSSGYSTAGDLGAGCAYVQGGTGPGQVSDASARVWHLATDKPVSVGCFGATGNGTTDDTAAINAAIVALSDIYVPCGTYAVGALTMAGNVNAQPQRHIHGAGFCSMIKQTTSLSSPILSIGSGTVDDTGGVVVDNLAFNASAQKTAGAVISAKGTSKPQFSNLYGVGTVSTSGVDYLYDGIDLDGVDNASISHVVLGNLQHDGIAAWDGFNCNGVTPVYQTIQSISTSGSTTTLVLNSASGVVAGESAYLSTVPNTGTWGSVAAVSGTTVTINGILPITVSAGWGVTFGVSCNGANLTLDRDTEVTNAKNNGVALYGGIGGLFLNSAHIYGSGIHGVYFSTLNSTGQSNREIFLTSGVDIDSNPGVGVYADTDSITRLSAFGAWIVANSGGNVFIAGQSTNYIPKEPGAIVQFSGGNIASSTSYGLHWQDTGTLQIDGVNISYNSGDGVQIASNSNVGDVTVTGSYIRGNGGYGVDLTGTAPGGMSYNSNTWTNNTSGAHTSTVSTTTAICQANRGGTSGC